jgi:predicted branched-subunit amino acid permease
VFTALFVALLAARYRDGRDLLPWLAAAATVVAVRRTGNLLLALALGVACVWVLRIVFERAMEVVLMIARIWRGLTPAEQADA